MNWIVLLTAAFAVVPAAHLHPDRNIDGTTNRNDDSLRGISLSFLSMIRPKPENACIPGSCIVVSGLLCACATSKSVICFQPEDSGIRGTCACTPGRVFNTRKSCTCPITGKIHFYDCDYRVDYRDYLDDIIDIIE